MDHKSKQGWKVMIPHTAINPDVRKYLEDRGHTIFLYPSRPGVDVSFSEIESPSLLVRRGSLSLLRGRKSNLVRIQQARHPSRRIRWWRSAS
jgi:hypothetical protein